MLIVLSAVNPEFYKSNNCYPVILMKKDGSSYLWCCVAWQNSTTQWRFAQHHTYFICGIPNYQTGPHCTYPPWSSYHRFKDAAFSREIGSMCYVEAIQYKNTMYVVKLIEVEKNLLSQLWLFFTKKLEIFSKNGDWDLSCFLQSGKSLHSWEKNSTDLWKNPPFSETRLCVLHS